MGSGDASKHVELDLENETRIMAGRMELTPLRQPGRPEEIGGTVSFLASGRADFISAHILAIDGGILITDGN